VMLPASRSRLSDALRSLRLFPLLDELDHMVVDHGGRVYLAKDALLSPELVGRMYPRVGEFRRLRAAHAPMRRFGSSLARRLKLGGEP